MGNLARLGVQGARAVVQNPAVRQTISRTTTPFLKEVAPQIIQQSGRSLAKQAINKGMQLGQNSAASSLRLALETSRGGMQGVGKALRSDAKEILMQTSKSMLNEGAQRGLHTLAHEGAGSVISGLVSGSVRAVLRNTSVMRSASKQFSSVITKVECSSPRAARTIKALKKVSENTMVREICKEGKKVFKDEMKHEFKEYVKDEIKSCVDDWVDQGIGSLNELTEEEFAETLERIDSKTDKLKQEYCELRDCFEDVRTLILEKAKDEFARVQEMGDKVEDHAHAYLDAASAVCSLLEEQLGDIKALVQDENHTLSTLMNLGFSFPEMKTDDIREQMLLTV